jgi:hypothetical protein
MGWMGNRLLNLEAKTIAKKECFRTLLISRSSDFSLSPIVRAMVALVPVRLKYTMTVIRFASFESVRRFARAALLLNDKRQRLLRADGSHHPSSRAHWQVDRTFFVVNTMSFCDGY